MHHDPDYKHQANRCPRCGHRRNMHGHNPLHCNVETKHGGPCPCPKKES